jgi:hypothetical protein
MPMSRSNVGEYWSGGAPFAGSVTIIDRVDPG